jgi:hypothetical protein
MLAYIEFMCNHTCYTCNTLVNKLAVMLCIHVHVIYKGNLRIVMDNQIQYRKCRTKLRIFFVEFVPLRKGKKFVLNDRNKVPCLHLLKRVQAREIQFSIMSITLEVSKV